MREGQSLLSENLRKSIVQIDVFFLNCVSWTWGVRYKVDEDARWAWGRNGTRWIKAILADQQNYTIKRVK